MPLRVIGFDMTIYEENGFANRKAYLIDLADSYGLDNKLTYDENKPMVEFYDSRYPHTEYGQFISRYYIGTILCLDGYYGRPLDNGLCLDGGNPNEWSVSSCEMQVVKDYVSQYI